MQIHSLKNNTIEQITECFNKAFETYIVPMKLNAEQLLEKIKSEHIVLEHSVGITIDNELAGFILIGMDTEKNIAYNAGTGVIEKCRGQKLTEKMYGFLLSDLEKIGIQDHLLEVICNNQKALKVYENLNYSVLRKVICYKGKIVGANHTNYKIEIIDLPNTNRVKPLWNHEPTYQNSLYCIKNNSEKHSAYGAFEDEKLIAYIIFHKDSLRIKQFGVHEAFRNQGLGQKLFYEVQKQNPEKEVTLINIDEGDFETNNFLKNIGLSPFIEQYEMKLKT